MALPTPRQLPGRRSATLLLAGLLAAAVASQAFAVPRSGTAMATADLAPSAANPLLRVLLQQGSVLEPRAEGGPLQLRDGQGRELLRLPQGERLRIQRDGGGLVLDRPDSPDPQLAAPQRLALQVLVLEPAPPATGGRGPLGSANGIGGVLPWAGALQTPQALVALGRRAYRGALQVRPEGSALMALNLIPLETYLPSVVGSEMPARWPAEALRAQAVAARTYALAQLKPASLYDLKATVASQAYLGVEAETPSTRAAVAATRSQVLRFGGTLIDAVFHSSSGGSTENSGETWNRQLPYLVSVPDGDDQSPWRQWSLRIEPQQLRRAFRETAGANRIEVLATSSTGRVRRARVIGPAGSLDLSGGELRQRLGLRSTLVQFRFEDPAGQASGGRAPDPAAGPGEAPRVMGGGITAATARAAAAARYGGGWWPPAGQDPSAPSSGRRTPPAGPGAGPSPPPPLPALVDSATGAVAPAGALDEASTEAPAVAPAPAQFAPVLSAQLPALEVVGRGFGHGVGMSQWGAYALALRGKDYGAILRHYYRGAELVPYAGR
ncbi:MAG: SpoIID/LytB domain-containing protein [Cyanobium sp.]